MACTGTNCWADVEWFCEHAGLVRVFSGGQKYGEPYCYALPFAVAERYEMPRDGKYGLVEFMGVVKVMSPCQYRAMRKAMRDAGWGILSTRIKDGQKRTIEICKRGSDG